jgi:hypothetical protein
LIDNLQLAQENIFIPTRVTHVVARNLTKQKIDKMKNMR